MKPPATILLLSAAVVLAVMGTAMAAHSLTYGSAGIPDSLCPGEEGISWIIVEIRSGRVIEAMNPQKLFAPPRSVGSLMKVLAAYRAVSMGLWDPGAIHFCRPWKKGGRCWNPNGHGIVNLEQAISISCNDYFLRLESCLDPDETIAWYSSIGVAGLSGIRRADRTGPDSADRTVSGSSTIPRGRLIGHDDEATAVPASVLTAVAALFNGGWTFRLDTGSFKLSGRIAPSPEALAVIRRGMAGCSWSGTGSPSPDPALTVLGKTGTSLRNGHSSSRKRETNGWYIGLWPEPRPRFGILLLAEHEKGSAAARRALEIIKTKNRPGASR